MDCSLFQSIGEDSDGSFESCTRFACTFHDFFRFIPEEDVYTVSTTSQADMNISSGKTGLRQIIASSELDAPIEAL